MSTTADTITGTLEALLASSGHDLAQCDTVDTMLDEAQRVADLAALATELLGKTPFTADAEGGLSIVELSELHETGGTDAARTIRRRRFTRERALVVSPHEATTLAYYLPGAYGDAARELADASWLTDITHDAATLDRMRTMADVARDLNGISVGEPARIQCDRERLLDLVKHLLAQVDEELADPAPLDDEEGRAGLAERGRHLRRILDELARDTEATRCEEFLTTAQEG